MKSFVLFICLCIALANGTEVNRYYYYFLSHVKIIRITSVYDPERLFPMKMKTVLESGFACLFK